MRSLQATDLQFAQQHLRILDALYGLLRPLDCIKPYRLEMSNKIKTEKGQTLYAFWGNALTQALNRQVLQAQHVSKHKLAANNRDKLSCDRALDELPSKSRFIVNCASQVTLCSTVCHTPPCTCRSLTQAIGISALHFRLAIVQPQICHLLGTGVLQSCPCRVIDCSLVYNVLPWACCPCQSSQVTYLLANSMKLRFRSQLITHTLRALHACIQAGTHCSLSLFCIAEVLWSGS